ncbi:enolase C-terminal domain-like protein [Apodospora peruviana]|uniref:Enolase C-terminal domain-like protein n=1 Tax=Apodospora peruviana TaxID=516989 RepID=A0AAE0IS05_9PEZI|nr:enolase C-terminal domain-like protein [Apodospora peruviana]
MNPSHLQSSNNRERTMTDCMKLTCKAETFLFNGNFTTSHGTRTEAHVVTATLRSGDTTGRGECVPSDRYGETVDNVMAAIEKLACLVERFPDREHLQKLLPLGAARNAINCALWNLEAKRSGRLCFQQAGLGWSEPVTAFTISLDEPVVMAMEAAREATRPLLKVKLGGDGDEARLQAVRKAAPSAKLIPLPAGSDEALAHFAQTIQICAHESIRDGRELAELKDRYDAVNVKLDKAGGLTEALETVLQARSFGFGIMVGSTVGTLLAMAPALLLANHADYVDLDGPLLLDQDREVPLVYEGSTMRPPDGALWG